MDRIRRRIIDIGEEPVPPMVPQHHRAVPVDPYHPIFDPAFDEERHEERRGLDHVVFWTTAVIALSFVAWGLLSTATLSSAASGALGWVVHSTGWLFSLAATGFVIFVIWLAASRYGSIPLGRTDETPEFNTVSWTAMMFSAGMGIGLMFYGVGEPLAHFTTPPPGTGPEGNAEALQHAMATTLFHWTLHPWAIYAVVGLAIGYGVFRRGRTLLISSAFEPLLGRRRANGPLGKVIDMLAIFATLFGSAASLGLGAIQIGSGLEIVAGIGAVGNTMLVIVITVLTMCFILSAVSGVARGIQWLSNTNMVLALVLSVFVFLVGPTVFILNVLPTSLGSYLQDIPMMASRTEATTDASVSAWLSTWTIFYWAWWVSWTPFVGMFIARISRGRTIRQFVTGVLLVPSLVSLVWFAIYGGTAINMQQNGVDLAGQSSAESSLFTMLDNMPWATVTSVIVMVLVAIFFVSGADAASIVMGTLSERGSLEPRRGTVIFWGSATGAVAAVMLIVGGSDALSGLQNITIVAGLPFLIVMILLAVSLTKDLATDPLVIRRHYSRAVVERAVLDGVYYHGEDFELHVMPSDDGHEPKTVLAGEQQEVRVPPPSVDGQQH